MRTHHLLDATGGAPTIALHLGQALRATDTGALLAAAVAVSAGTLDGMLASIHVGDVGTLVAYRAEAVGEAVGAAVGCPS